ncbi:alginate export family protein [Marinoscillum sp. MHG1-6]|uniref:alginate export family protein n=1 Tax=Marinoscillum sp. MHG1-6 TaxID=2959627 RepID=UPI00215735DA|nr:alginate export family protein [Marinoscillum sp. MHG1-6]
MKRFIYLFALLAGLVTFQSNAQFKLTGEIRPRTEVYNGNNSTLATKDQRWGVATQQRTRLNFVYEDEGLKFVFSPQLIHFWGQMPQAYDLLGDGAPGSPEGNFSVFEAYGAYKFSDAFTLQFGRQAISYGDQRWFGALGWAASGRSHDAFVGKFSLGSAKLDVGAALNQTKHVNALDSAAISNIRAGYKSLQYAWLTLPAGDLKINAMVTNVTGLKSLSSSAVKYKQTTTVGLLPSYSTGDVAINASAYYQTGENLSSYLLAADITYKGLGLPITLGADIVSGDDEGTADSETWQQPFGTNHKFYGFMDFFYVGETPKMGLNDFYIKSVIKTGEKTKLIAFVHQFMTNQSFTNGASEEISGNLGTEIDLVYNYNVAAGFNIKVGYSKLFADDNFESYKPGDASAGNQWGWVQLTLTPGLIK